MHTFITIFYSIIACLGLIVVLDTIRYEIKESRKTGHK